MIERIYLQEFTKRMSEERKFIQVIFEPQPVGKI